MAATTTTTVLSSSKNTTNATTTTTISSSSACGADCINYCSNSSTNVKNPINPGVTNSCDNNNSSNTSNNIADKLNTGVLLSTSGTVFYKPKRVWTKQECTYEVSKSC